MRHRSKFIIIPALLTCWSVSRLAAAQAEVEAIEESNKAVEMVTYLGIETSRVSKALRNHVNIPEGVGLTVDHVAEDSGAAEAGLQPFDILLKLDDQIIINQDQLSTLIRSKNPGDKVVVEILRKGKKEKIRVELGEKEAVDFFHWGRNFNMPNSVPRPPNPPQGDWSFDFNMEDFQERMKEFSERAAEMGNKALQFIPEIIIEQKGEDGTKRITSIGRGPKKISITKDTLTARMEMVDGTKNYYISQKEGEIEKVLYQGDEPTRVELESLPQNVQDLIKKLNEPKTFKWNNMEELKKENIRVIINTGQEEAKAAYSDTETDEA